VFPLYYLGYTNGEISQDLTFIRQVASSTLMINIIRYVNTTPDFYSARNARIAGAVLATAIPSVRPSVTRRYCVKTTARSMVQFAPLDSKMCLVL